MERHESNSQLAKFLPRQKRHPLVLAEHDHLAVFLDGDSVKNLAELLSLGEWWVCLSKRNVELHSMRMF